MMVEEPKTHIEEENYQLSKLKSWSHLNRKRRNDPEEPH
jgi:hypothetical protein